jgi:glutamyl-tRNA synthetase
VYVYLVLESERQRIQHQAENRKTVSYRGRIAPSPTGYLHLGHARTFWTAYQRSVTHHGVLVFRNEDLDVQRCRSEFVEAMFEDLRWLGIGWQEGPDVGGPYAPYEQHVRTPQYLTAWYKLARGGYIYPCRCSRKDLASALEAPHESGATGDEPLYPGTCRPLLGQPAAWERPGELNWRFRVSDGAAVSFPDLRQGEQQFTAGKDFGDFLVWRKDGVPSYQLAVVVDDAAMEITEVVRGCDLLKSTARQILLARALELPVLDYYHCDLMTDARGVRLAKRHDALSLRSLRAQGLKPEDLRESWGLV